jgi:hypothetical protein
MHDCGVGLQAAPRVIRTFVISFLRISIMEHLSSPYYPYALFQFFTPLIFQFLSYDLRTTQLFLSPSLIFFFLRSYVISITRGHITFFLHDTAGYCYLCLHRKIHILICPFLALLCLRYSWPL